MGTYGTSVCVAYRKKAKQAACMIFLATPSIHCTVTFIASINAMQTATPLVDVQVRRPPEDCEGPESNGHKGSIAMQSSQILTS